MPYLLTISIKAKQIPSSRDYRIYYKVNNSHLKVLYTNANGLYGKLGQLRLIVESDAIDLICVTETHFDDSLELAEIEIPGFNVFLGKRNFKLDRTCSQTVDYSNGGGSVIYIRDNILVVDGSHDYCMDSTSVTIETDIGKILIRCFYRSASLNDSQNTEFLKYFCSKISSDYNVEKVIFGDFNCPDISWLSGNVAGPADTINKSLLCQRSFLDIVHEYGLSWLITNDITRRRKVGNVVQESTIDQVLLSEESLVSEFKISQPLGKSDHVTIVTDLNICKRDGSHCHDVDDVRRNWAKTEPPELLELSSKIDWNYSKKLDEMSVDEVWEEVHAVS